MMTLTFRYNGPSDAELSEAISGGAIGDTPAPAVYKLVLVSNDGEAEDVKMSAVARQMAFVGTGDQRPAALASWTPPNTSSAYVGGLLDLLQAARVADLNDARVKLGQAIARIEALTALLAARGITEGT